jgi:hypothetical protein
MLSAAPPRPSPSIRVSTTPEMPSFSSKFGGDVDGVLAGQPIDHQKRLARVRDIADGRDLLHQARRSMQPPGGVEHQHVIATEARLLLGAARDLHRVLAGHDRQRVDADLPAEHRKLFHRRGPVGVERGHQHALAASRSKSRLASFAVVVVLPEPCRPTIRIAAGGLSIFSAPGSPSPVSTWTSSSWTILTTCWPGVTDLVIAWPVALLHPANEIARHGQRDIGFQQRHAHLAQGGLDVVLAQRALLGQPVEDAREAFGKRFEHGARAPWLRSANAHAPPRAQRADGGRS